MNVPYNLFGFFRQSLQEDSVGVEMVETSFINYVKNNKTNSKRTKNYSKSGTGIHGGVAIIIEEANFVRIKSYFLNATKVNQYKFNYKGSINYGNLKVYKIGFEPKDKNNLKFIKQGVLYIDSKSLAIIEIKFHKLRRKRQSFKKADKRTYTLIELDNSIKYRQLPNKKWVLSFVKINNILKGVYKKQQYLYKLTIKTIINNVKIKKAVPVKTNYDLSKDFNEVVKKFNNLDKWGNSYQFSLSNTEKRILKDIKNAKAN